jgi:hypothetical protein
MDFAWHDLLAQLSPLPLKCSWGHFSVRVHICWTVASKACTSLTNRHVIRKLVRICTSCILLVCYLNVIWYHSSTRSESKLLLVLSISWASQLLVAHVLAYNRGSSVVGRIVFFHIHHAILSTICLTATLYKTTEVVKWQISSAVPSLLCILVLVFVNLISDLLILFHKLKKHFVELFGRLNLHLLWTFHVSKFFLDFN